MDPICLNSTLHTYQDRYPENRVLYRVIGQNTDSGEGVELSALATDAGIAAVEAFEYLHQQHRSVRLLSCRTQTGLRDDCYIDDLSHRLLLQLHRDNRYLVAAYLSAWCGCIQPPTVQAIQAREQILNTVWDTGKSMLPDPMEPRQILSRHRHIWHSYLFTESTDPPLEARREMAACAASSDPLLIWYWTFMLSLWGQYECYFPARLYEAILTDAFRPYYGSFPALQALCCPQR